MSRALYGAPAQALSDAPQALAKLAWWVSWTADPDLPPDVTVSTRNMRDAAATLRKTARQGGVGAQRSQEHKADIRWRRAQS